MKRCSLMIASILGRCSRGFTSTKGIQINRASGIAKTPLFTDRIPPLCPETKTGPSPIADLFSPARKVISDIPTPAYLHFPSACIQSYAAPPIARILMHPAINFFFALQFQPLATLDAACAFVKERPASLVFRIARTLIRNRSTLLSAFHN